jgi:hypothetical protein
VPVAVSTIARCIVFDFPSIDLARAYLVVTGLIPRPLFAQEIEQYF